MKILLNFLLILTSSVLLSQQQNYSFGYRLEYLSDSTNIFNKKSEDFTLFVESGKSYFVSDNFVKHDSIVKAISKTLDFNFSNTPNTRFKTVIIKDNEAKNLTFYDNFLKYFFRYKETPKIEWKLINEKSKIGTFNCSKAVADYGGRTWEAWYTEEIPISDGPYKFKGLPGLIVKINDTENNYNYELISIKKKSRPNNVIFSEEYLNKHKSISKEDYVKALKNINENFINELSASGLIVAPESVEMVKANNKKRNNPIELK